jgi:SAM-dependent methyltransferase
MERESYKEMYNYENIHWWFVARRTIIKKILCSYFENDKSERTILDIGCGSGGNLQMFSEYGNVSAMELDDEARANANNRNVCHVKKGMMPNDIPFKNNFDLICMMDVLEHIENDLDTLKAIKNKLNKNGKLLIAVPAYQFLWSCHDVAHHHKRRYTKKQLTGLISKAGLQITYSTYFDSFLLPFVLIVRVLSNFVGKNSGSNLILPLMPINKLFTTIFSSERFFLPAISFPFGISVLLIIQKEEDLKTFTTKQENLY